jgi:hypothetical protein
MNLGLTLTSLSHIVSDFAKSRGSRGAFVTYIFFDKACCLQISCSYQSKDCLHMGWMAVHRCAESCNSRHGGGCAGRI